MNSKKMEIVQVMRAYACISIFLYHLPESWGIIKSKYSSFSLVVFFIFTGYFLIEGTRKSEKNYFIKKIIRLVPLYWLLTIILFLLSLLIPGINGGKIYSFEDLVKSLFFIPYYSADGKLFPILSPGWTLILEVYEYIVFWILYMVLKKNKNRDILTVIFFAALVIVVKIISSHYLINIPILVLWSYKYQWAFLIGMLISIFKNKKYENIRLSKELSTSWRVIIGVIYALVFAVCTYIVNDSFAIILGTIATALGLMIFPFQSFSKWIVGIGNMSFSFYLVHKFVIAVVNKIVNRMLPEMWRGILGVIIAFALTLIASIICYNLIERRLSGKLKELLCK